MTSIILYAQFQVSEFSTLQYCVFCKCRKQSTITLPYGTEYYYFTLRKQSTITSPYENRVLLLYLTQTLLRDFNVTLGTAGIFIPTIGNKSLHENSNGNGVHRLCASNIWLLGAQCSHTHKFINIPGRFLMDSLLNWSCNDRQEMAFKYTWCPTFRGFHRDIGHYTVV